MKIDHVGIAVRALERSLPFWAEALGLEVTGIETVESEKVKVALLQVGSSRIELLEPTESGSSVGKYLDKRGEGIHHLTFEVRDLQGSLDRLRERGVRLIDETPRVGAEGRSVAFIHPKATGGVLVELVSPRIRERRTPRLEPGNSVVLYLRDPSEKVWGVLRRLDTTGIVVEGIDLGSFDDWIAQVGSGEENIVGPSVLFVPMARLERMLLDRSSGNLPSMADQFLKRTGRSVQEVLDEMEPEH